MPLRKTLVPLLVLLLFPAVCPAETDTFISVADADIWEYTPDDNRGDEQYFQVGCGGAGYWRNSLVRFDLAPISGATVNSAVLRLMVVDYWGDFPTDEVFIARNADYWEEMTVTWNNRPNIAEVDPIPAPGICDWWEIDVTAWVQGMADGTLDNYGFQIYQNDTDYAGFTMRSREMSDPPELFVDYTPMDLQNETFASIKALYR